MDFPFMPANYSWKIVLDFVQQSSTFFKISFIYIVIFYCLRSSCNRHFLSENSTCTKYILNAIEKKLALII